MSLYWITVATLIASSSAAIAGYLNWVHSTNEDIKSIYHYVNMRFKNYGATFPEPDFSLEITRVNVKRSRNRRDVMKQSLIPMWGPKGTLHLRIEFSDPVDEILELEKKREMIRLHDLGLQETTEVEINHGRRDYTAVLPSREEENDVLYVHIGFNGSSEIWSIFNDLLMDININISKQMGDNKDVDTSFFDDIIGSGSEDVSPNTAE